MGNYFSKQTVPQDPNCCNLIYGDTIQHHRAFNHLILFINLGGIRLDGGSVYDNNVITHKDLASDVPVS